MTEFFAEGYRVAARVARGVVGFFVYPWTLARPASGNQRTPQGGTVNDEHTRAELDEAVANTIAGRTKEGPGMRTCAICERRYEDMEGMVNGLDYCHPDDSTGMTCYMRASSGVTMPELGESIKPFMDAVKLIVRPARPSGEDTPTHD